MSQKQTVEEMVDSIMICVCKDRGGKELCVNCGKPTVKAQVRKIITSLHHSYTEEVEQARREERERVVQFLKDNGEQAVQDLWYIHRADFEQVLTPNTPSS